MEAGLYRTEIDGMHHIVYKARGSVHQSIAGVLSPAAFGISVTL